MSPAGMRTVDEILVRADTDTVFGLAADLQRWPDILPHYRWVKVLSERDGQREVEMAARRGQIPVQWTAVQTVFPDQHRIHYSHTGGATRGMEVEWSLTRAGELVRATIVHELDLKAPIVRTSLGRWIVGRFFVHYIAGRTLRTIKRLAEEGSAASCGAR